jgi:membrane fusion protein, multidrug efflux system
VVTRGLAVAALAAAVLAAPACSQSSPSAAPGGKGAGAAGRTLQFPVEVQPVAERAVEYTVHGVGSIEPFEQVQVTARVAGAVDAVSFAEGDTVKAGRVLVTIDAARFGVAHKQAEADVAGAKAALDDAQAGLDRRLGAEKTSPGLIPAEEIATYRTKVETASADLAARKLAAQRAQLDLHDAYVRAPVAGIIQTRTVQTGQYVQPGAVLATLVRRDPLLVKFDVAETDAAHLAPGMAARFRVAGMDRDFTAKITLVAELADPTSRMVKVTGEVDDKDAAQVRAGAFAQVTVPIGGRPDAPVVPESAVRPSEKGFLAYIVEGGVARERVVELGMRTSDGLVEVKKGLAPGDELVVRGAEALRDGAPVKATPAGKSPPAGTPPPAGGAP